MKNYKIIEIKEYNSLNEVAQRLGLELSEFVGFHNLYAKDKDVIVSNDQKNIHSFYVYDWIFEKITDPSLKVPLGENYKLEHYPTTQTLRYGVMYYFDNDDVVKFEMDLDFKKQNNYFTSRINRVTPVFINDIEVDTIADEVAQIIGKNLYPIDLLVDETGNFVKVLNFEAIKARWQQTTQEVYQHYEGDWIEEVLQNNENNLEDETEFTQLLQQDLFVKSYFSGIYGCYFKEYSFQKELTFPLLESSTPVSYQVKYTIKELWDEDNLIKITANGIYNDTRCLEDFQGQTILDNEENGTTVTGNYKAKYFLEPTTHTIKSLYAECDLDVKEDNSVSVKIVASKLSER